MGILLLQKCTILKKSFYIEKLGRPSFRENHTLKQFLTEIIASSSGKDGSHRPFFVNLVVAAPRDAMRVLKLFKIARVFEKPAKMVKFARGFMPKQNRGATSIKMLSDTA